ncbi:DNA-processing protein DprA [Ruegeria atlantica]|uniref:DNA-protecting protein DprA n=1 Tax=Ruegeria atlantica TaxID=81569 RepID=A0ABX1WCM7_9RHOB|nr:DNA-processing protein DprA [Ruegeria atlantica]NOD31041.1 DNA-protecting protein DprA [Ruegeria atlantica]
MTEEQLSSNHPPLPPTTEEDRFSWLRLLRSRKVGPATFRRLLREHGSAQNALAALPEMARAAGIKGYETCPPGVIEAELRAAKAAKARLLCLGSAEFPAALAELNEAPPLLWAIGDVSLLQKPAIAMVGARNCSSLGARMARGLATELGSKGHVIVSGLARGIDTAAHMAALETGTVAVMAGGVDVIYPAENTELAHDIASRGLRISEQPMGVTPQARHFPRRNRIISGLALAVVVVEAAAKSGSLITARDALDQGREVLAVPGHPFDARAAGCNLLIRDGATLVRSAEDVIEALPQQDDPFSRPIEPRSEPIARPARNLHEQIIARLGPSPIAEDQLLRDIAASAGELGPALIDLELDGRIQRQPGGLLSLAS